MASFMFSRRPQLPSTACDGPIAIGEPAEAMGRAEKGGKDEGEGWCCIWGIGDEKILGFLC